MPGQVPAYVNDIHRIPVDMTSNSPESRYARQQQFAPVGTTGQQLIAQADVAVLGCGALGTVAAEILARGGVGRLRLIDRDVVEWTNLQRQSLFDQQDASEARSKAEAAAVRLAQINDSIEIEPVVADVTADNIRDILQDVDLVIDAADNFAVRFLLNDWSLSIATPWVHGGCVGAVGQVRLFTGDGPPCFRCLVPEPPPADAVETCDTAGVVGSATHAIASLQATEAIKWLSGNRDKVRTTLLSIDFWNNRIRELTIHPLPNESCPACGQRVFEFLDATGADSGSIAALCGREAVQICVASGGQVDLDKFARRWEPVGRVQTTRFFVRLFPSENHSLTLFRDGRVVVSGTTEVGEARSLYDRFVGG